MKRKLLILPVFTLVFAVDYETEIQPIFDNNCGNCHLGNSSGGLNLSNYDNLMSSDVIVAGSHLQSELYDRITRDNTANGDMPPGNSELSQNQIDLIAQWIDEGALAEESSDVFGCMDSNAITCDDEIDPLYFPQCDTCSNDDPCDNYYNPNVAIINILSDEPGGLSCSIWGNEGNDKVPLIINDYDYNGIFGQWFNIGAWSSPWYFIIDENFIYQVKTQNESEAENLLEEMLTNLE